MRTALRCKESSRLAPLPIIVILLVLSIIITSWYYWSNSLTLIIKNQKTGELYFSQYIECNDTLTYKWIHSFEHIPWHEDYIINRSGQLILNEIKVAGFGAGIPENKGTVTIENGMIKMTNLEQSFSKINWIHSVTALESISINNHIFVHGRDLPHHEPLVLVIEKGFKL